MTKEELKEIIDALYADDEEIDLDEFFRDIEEASRDRAERLLNDIDMYANYAQGDLIEMYRNER